MKLPKLSRKTVIILEILFVIIGVALFVLFENKNTILAFSLFGFMGVLTIIFNVLFNRCPHCNKFLGRNSGKYCHHCAKNIYDINVNE